MYFLNFFQNSELAVHPYQRENRNPPICVKQTRVNSFDELEIGDHLVFHRILYDHHGILTDKRQGRFQVAEATKTDSRSMASSIGKVKLQLSWKTLDSEEGGVSVASYINRFYSKPNTALRAVHFYEKSKEDHKFYQYNLFSNNCEHFATYCATGKMYSLQVAEFVSRALPSYIEERLRFRITGNNEQSKNYICIPCENIESKNDVKKGDIIEYFENDIWHHALVIDTLGHTTKDVSCSVSHCKSCVHSHDREIKREDIVITFKKLFYKLDFESSGFEIHKPNLVVDREENARQIADSLTNACSQFPIWCKLKL